MPEAPEKLFVSASQLNTDSVRLGRKVWESGFRPDFLIGIWRGGTPSGIIIHEFLRMKGIDPYHTTIKTQSYQGMQRSDAGVEIKGLEHLIDVIEADHQLLLVDDVFDTGHTMAAIVSEIRTRSRRNCPDCRIATVYYKPERNETDIVPDYAVLETDEWIVFPHELEGLSEDEIRAKGAEISAAVLTD
jgi:hypothetical protein